MSKKVNEFEYTDDAEQLASRISQLEARVNTITKDIHTTVCGVIMYTVKSGRVDLINKLCDAINEGIWKRGLNVFINDLGPVTWNKAEKKEGKIVKPAHWSLDATKRKAIQANAETHLAKMLATPYWQHTEQKSDEFEGMSFANLLAIAIKKCERTLKDDSKKDHANNDFAGLEQGRQLLAALTKKGKAPAAPVSAPAEAAVTVVH